MKEPILIDQVEDTYSITAGEANVKSLLLVIPMAVILVVFYYLCWGWGKMFEDTVLLMEHPALSFIAVIFGVLLHELLHGLSWMFGAGLGRSAISYGFNFPALAPYAHCTEPMTAKAYRLGVIAPGLLLGILPGVLGLLTGMTAFFWFGFIFTLAAAGDFLILWIIRKIPPDQQVEDHPDRVGCVIAGQKSNR